jgi:hypothetical protein
VTTFSRDQGDQIRRIFPQWVIVYFGQYFENHKSNPNFCATFFRRRDYVLIGLGYISGDFFTNSSVHPARDGPDRQMIQSCLDGCWSQGKEDEFVKK